MRKVVLARLDISSELSRVSADHARGEGETRQQVVIVQLMVRAKSVMYDVAA